MLFRSFATDHLLAGFSTTAKNAIVSADGFSASSLGIRSSRPLSMYVAGHEESTALTTFCPVHPSAIAVGTDALCGRVRCVHIRVLECLRTSRKLVKRCLTGARA